MTSSGSAAEDSSGVNADLRDANEKLLLAAIREQALAEEARASEAKLKAVLENMAEGVSVFDENGALVMINAAGRAIVGIAGDSPSVGDFARCEFRREDGSPFDFLREVVEQLLRGVRLVEEEVAFRRPTGDSWRRLLLSGSSVSGADGQVKQAVTVFRDITEMRELESLRRLYFAVVSHDLQGPLLAVKLDSELLATDENAAPAVRRIGGRMLESVARANELLEGLINADKKRFVGEAILRKAPCDAAALIPSALKDLSPFRAQRVAVLGEPSLVGVWNEQEVRRAVWNLISNAFEHGARDRPVKVTLAREGASASISVHNEGPPIPPQDLERIFQPYFRGEAAVLNRQGKFGLGLAQVQACAVAHQGAVTIRSDATHGTTFTLLLPLQPDPDRDPNPRDLLGA